MQYVILRHVNSSLTTVYDTVYDKHEAMDKCDELGNEFGYDLAENAWIAKAKGNPNRGSS